MLIKCQHCNQTALASKADLSAVSLHVKVKPATCSGALVSRLPKCHVSVVNI